jgi:hypothetical protein
MLQFLVTTLLKKLREPLGCFSVASTPGRAERVNTR